MTVLLKKLLSMLFLMLMRPCSTLAFLSSPDNSATERSPKYPNVFHILLCSIIIGKGESRASWVCSPVG